MNQMRRNSFEQDLEARYGAAFAQEIRDRLAQVRAQEYRSEQIKDLAVTVRRLRARVLWAVRACRTWKVESRIAGGQGASSRHLQAEGEELGRFLGNVLGIYRAALRDYHAVRCMNPGRLSRTESPSERTAAA